MISESAATGVLLSLEDCRGLRGEDSLRWPRPTPGRASPGVMSLSIGRMYREKNKKILELYSFSVKSCE